MLCERKNGNKKWWNERKFGYYIKLKCKVCGEKKNKMVI